MKLLTVKQAALLLGCHENSVRRMEARGLLPARRDVNGYRRFRLGDVRALLKQRRRLEPFARTGRP